MMEPSLMISNKDIPLVNLSAQYAQIQNEIDSAIADTIAESAFIGGRALSTFEKGFAEFCGVDHAVGVGSGTDALELLLEAYGIGQGDEVIVPTMTFAATAEAVVTVGAKPVFVDIDAKTLNINVNATQQAITPRTRAVIGVHLYGQPADLDALSELAHQSGLVLIEDAAQAHGAFWNGRRVSSIGHAAAFSFYPGKNLGAYGDAGAVVTNDDKIAKHVRLVANHGRTEKYTHQVSGRCSRLDGLQAAILGVKLRHIDAWNARRRQIAARYTERLASRVEIVNQDSRSESVFHLFVVQVPDRDRVRSELAKRGVSTGVHYPIPLHQQPAFLKYVDNNNLATSVASGVAGRVLSLPIFPELSDHDADHVADSLIEVLGA